MHTGMPFYLHVFHNKSLLYYNHKEEKLGNYSLSLLIIINKLFLLMFELRLTDINQPSGMTSCYVSIDIIVSSFRNYIIIHFSESIFSDFIYNISWDQSQTVYIFQNYGNIIQWQLIRSNLKIIKCASYQVKNRSSEIKYEWREIWGIHEETRIHQANKKASKSLKMFHSSVKPWPCQFKIKNLSNNKIFSKLESDNH